MFETQVGPTNQLGAYQKWIGSTSEMAYDCGSNPTPLYAKEQALSE